MRKGIPNDPGRRDRLRAVALEFIAERGLRRFTVRGVAERAGVSPGSITYYFTDTDELIMSAFELLTEHAEPNFNVRLRAAGTRDEAIEVLIDYVIDPDDASQQEVRAVRELYSLGSRDPKAAALVRDRLEANARTALMLHFTEPCAHALDALIEGLWTQRSWNDEPLDPGMVRTAIHGLVTAFDSLEGTSA
ncbi:Homeobox domain-like [Propionibacterium ruminifibrarum]|uniref:Homeobox domain-like n=1 Tax=Propionibacterium ruminifibrarum TaxID=1962131 RepID=A0A375I2K1_9ACTN|nr:TetR family transcriptional regulator [Propionibacterium ruminifibrarum]SPF69060.1 Homeobox domain-like [Propionibacterium ruminifibrarum]